MGKTGAWGTSQWYQEKNHREAVARKYEKVQMLQSLLEEWETRQTEGVFNDEDYQYVLDLRARLRSARCQFQSMKP